MRTAMLLLLTATSAQAFELKRDREGDVVRWKGALRFIVDRDLDQQLEAPGAVEAVKAAVKTWASAMPNVEVTVEAGDPAAPGNTITAVQRDWPHDDGVMGVAILKVDWANDRIVEADIRLNAAQNEFRVLGGDSRRGGRYADVQNTVTHELGHALGLLHEDGHQDAVMYPLAYNGEVNKRQLSPDDIAGLDALYPLTAPGAPPVGCSASGGAAPLAVALALLALSRPRSARSAAAKARS